MFALLWHLIISLSCIFTASFKHGLKKCLAPEVKLFYLKSWICTGYTPARYFSLSGITRVLTSFGRLPIKSVEVFSMKTIFWSILLYSSAIASQLEDSFCFEYTLWVLPLSPFSASGLEFLTHPVSHLCLLLLISTLLPCISDSLHRLQVSSCPCPCKALSLFWKKTWGAQQMVVEVTVFIIHVLGYYLHFNNFFYILTWVCKMSLSLWFTQINVNYKHWIVPDFSFLTLCNVFPCNSWPPSSKPPVLILTNSNWIWIIFK